MTKQLHPTPQKNNMKLFFILIAIAVCMIISCNKTKNSSRNNKINHTNRVLGFHPQDNVLFIAESEGEKQGVNAQFKALSSISGQAIDTKTIKGGGIGHLSVFPKGNVLVTIGYKKIWNTHHQLAITKGGEIRVWHYHNNCLSLKENTFIPNSRMRSTLPYQVSHIADTNCVLVSDHGGYLTQWGANPLKNLSENLWL